MISDKRGKKRRKLVAARIQESYRRSFTEQGHDEQAKDGKKKNRVYLVTIIEEGLGNSKDKNYYSKEALQTGAKVFNGAKAYCDHPDAITEKTLPERSMRDVVGWYSDCFTDSNPTSGKVRLRGKLHFFPDAKWLTDKIDTILTDPTAKDLFGISINAVGKTRPATMGGEEVNYVEQFQRVDSADVVTEPAARGKFDKMLESRRSVAASRSRKVNDSMRVRRTRESGVLSPEKAKEVADSLVSAYNSDNPDETKQAAYDAAKTLYAVSSISGKGSGQPNEEQYSNINPSGGSDKMATKKVKASLGKRSFRKGKRLHASSGTGADNENVDEPDEGDTEGHLEEADVEDKEGRGDLGDQAHYGGGSKYRKVKASREEDVEESDDEDVEESDEFEEDESLEGLEDEGLEGMEGLEDEGDEHGMGGGMPPSPGGMSPGASQTMASAESDDDEDGFDDDDDDIDDMDEADEEFGSPDLHRPGSVSEAGPRRRTSARTARPSRFARRRRTHEAASGSGQGSTKSSASFAGGLGHSGHTALSKGADPTRGYDDSDEDYGKADSSTSGVGKSYKLKTSRFARNRKMARVVKPIVREANRRIEFLTEENRRLRESNRAKDNKINRYRGKMRFIESQRSANALLREAVSKDILPENVAETLLDNLVGMKTRREQILEIKRTARLLESATEGTLSRLKESVEGSGARGGFAFRESAGADSELVDGLAEAGIPMMKEEE